MRISENQLTLPFGERSARAISHAYGQAGYEDRARFFWFMVGVAVLSLFVYVYAINATARNIALRGNLENRVTEAASRLGALEFAYIEEKNNISLDTAYAYGFKEATKPLYVSRKSSNALTLNTESR